MAEAIVLEGVSLTLPNAGEPTLSGVDLVIPEGELALVVGRTGSGKSTLLGAICGRVPHFTGGTLTGHVRIHGRDTRQHRPRDLADLVGVVGQDPLAGFVTDTVDEELAYGMEQLGLPPATMRKRVEETLDVLGIADLRGAALRELSGGQQQRVAIGSVLTAHPRVILLDEPTSALDPTGAEEVLATITRLVHDLGVTVVVAEHRIERVLHYADLVVHVGDARVEVGSPAEVMETSDVAPPVVELGRLAGWSPLPLSVRDARRAARSPGLPGDLTSASRGWFQNHMTHPSVLPRSSASRASVWAGGSGVGAGAGASVGAAAGSSAALNPAVSGRQVVVTYPGGVLAVAGVDLDLYAGQVTALMGRNGSGKSSLLWALQGTGTRTSGEITATDSTGARVDPAGLRPGERRRIVGMVPQTASDLLYLETAAAECAQADRESGAAPGTAASLVLDLVPDLDLGAHPRDLSEGQKLALVLAVQLTARPPVLLLDEPTRGLDYDAKAALSKVLRHLASQGRAVAVSTHDVEFVAECADRVLVLAGGEVVADGPTADIVVASPAYAPQVSKILGGPWLTVDDVRAVLSGVAKTSGSMP